MAHDLPVASAQVKSAILLAGLRCGVTLREPRRSRDHTERMLLAMGASLAERDGWLALQPSVLQPVDLQVPGDLSSAAFLVVAALLVPGSHLEIRNVGVNPTRTGVLDVLRAMGADLVVEPRDATGTEPTADLVVRASALRGTVIDGELALRSLDELVILSIAAAFAEGTTTIADARELRVKESDRIARVALGLQALGIAVEEKEDGLVITGGRPHGRAVIDADHDHRLAMAFSVAGLVTPGGVEIRGEQTVRSSWPSFFETLAGLTGAASGAR
jgi:3-phosphoshikimate 1-carboxyvinyltransferase